MLNNNLLIIFSESLTWMDREDVTSGNYVTYKGSLTTPPYTECVTWIIYEKPVHIGMEQVCSYHKSMFLLIIVILGGKSQTSNNSLDRKK